jgi:hypothetical protein
MTRKPATASIVAAGVLLLLLVLGGGPPAARAAPPRIDDIRPSGVRRGEAVELTVQGANLAGNPRLVAPFACRAEPLDPKRSGDSAWTFRIIAAADAPVGVYPLRVQTVDGLSNPFLLAIGQFPQVAEKEDNGAFESAQALPPTPLVVEGHAAGNDVDYFRFAGKKGQRIVVDAQCARIGSGVDPSIRLTTASAARRFVASADDSLGLLTDARLVVELPEDGDYVIELSDSRYQGEGRAVYRLLVGPVPLAEEVYPLGGRLGETVGLELRGGTLGGLRFAAAHLDPWPGTELHLPRIAAAMAGLALPGGWDVEGVTPRVVGTAPELREPAGPAAGPFRVAAPVVLNGRIDPPGDEDQFVLAVTPGQRLHLAVEASRLGSALDGVLQVRSGGSAIASADDTTTEVPGQPAGKGTLVDPDPGLDLTVPGGASELTVVIRDLEDRGGVGFPYRLVVTPIVPGFELAVNEPQVSVPRGGTATVGVSVTRKDFNGAITLTVVDPPAGLTVRPGTVAAGQAVGVLSLSASATAAFGAVPLRLVGRADGPSGPIEAEATASIVFAKQGILATNALTQYGLAAAPALPPPVTLDAPAGPIEVAHGSGGSIPIVLKRAKGADAALAVSPLPLPPGLAVPAATLAEKATTGTVAVNAAPEAALGLVTIGLVAKGKLPGGERTLSIPAVTLHIVRPAEVVLAAPTFEIKAGTTVEVKGKVRRKGAFKEPVTIRIHGLPAGLTADPAAVAPGASDFAVKVTAEPKAPAATATAQVVTAYQVNKKDYPTTPLPLAVKVVPAR